MSVRLQPSDSSEPVLIDKVEIIALSTLLTALVENPNFDPLLSVAVSGISLAALQQLLEDAAMYAQSPAGFVSVLAANGTGARVALLLASATYLRFDGLRQVAASQLANVLQGLSMNNMRTLLKWPGDRFLAEERESRLKENGLRLEDDES